MEERVSVSPTQIETWNLCQRKFGFIYFARLPRPGSKSLDIGNNAHGRLESYLKTGTPDYSYDQLNGVEMAGSRILTAIVPLVPAPSACFSEEKFTHEHEGILFGGRLDWRIPDVEIGDLKTTGNIKYVPSLEELRKKPQPVVYSLRYPHHACYWLYAPTNGGTPIPRRFFADMNEGLAAIMESARQITIAWQTRPDPATMEPNPAACSAFGGCPYRSTCKLEPSEMYFQLDPKRGPKMSVDMNAFLAQMRANQVTVTEVPAPVPPIDDTPSGVVFSPEFLAQPEAQAAAPAPAPAPTPAVEAPPTEPKKRGRQAKVQAVSPERHPVVDVQLDSPPPVAGTSARPISYLCVDCYPQGMGPTEEFADIVDEAHNQVKLQYDVSDFRTMDYGRGNGALVACVVGLLQALRPNSIVCVDSRTPEGTLCLSTLVAHSQQVIRGYK